MSGKGLFVDGQRIAVLNGDCVDTIVAGGVVVECKGVGSGIVGIGNVGSGSLVCGRRRRRLSVYLAAKQSMSLGT